MEHTHELAEPTAADFGVMIRGLQRDVLADPSASSVGLERLLRDDLADLGFPAHMIDHIEIGRDCRAEIQLHARLERLKAYESEVDAKRKLKTNLSAKQKSALLAAHSKVWTDMAALQQELKGIRHTAPRTTGHAFVCFKLERRRDELILKFRKPSLVSLAYWTYLTSYLFGLDKPPASARALPRLRTPASPEAPWGGLTVDQAPEPRDIYWANLVHDGTPHQTRARIFTRLMSVLIVGVGVLLCVFVQSVEAVFAKAQSQPSRLSGGGVRRGGGGFDYRTYGAQLASVVIVSLVNQLLKVVIPMLTRLESHRTLVAYEVNVYTKLTFAYVLNTALLPLTVGLLPIYITQAMYEEGGLVTQSIWLFIFSGLGFAFFQIVQLPAIFQRYVLGHMAVSQPQLDRLWRPPRYLFAQTYAFTTKLLALCIIYAPLWPPAYALTALLMLLSYVSVRVAIRFWYERPPPLDKTLIDEMCYNLLLILMIHAVVVHFVTGVARGHTTDRGSSIRLILMIAACALGFLAIRPPPLTTSTAGGSDVGEPSTPPPTKRRSVLAYVRAAVTAVRPTPLTNTTRGVRYDHISAKKIERCATGGDVTVTPHAARRTPHASNLAPRTSHLAPRASRLPHLAPHASHTSRLTPPIPYASRLPRVAGRYEAPTTRKARLLRDLERGAVEVWQEETIQPDMAKEAHKNRRALRPIQPGLKLHVPRGAALNANRAARVAPAQQQAAAPVPAGRGVQGTPRRVGLLVEDVQGSPTANS